MSLELFELLPHENKACRAWKTGVGTLPVRSHQCEPVRTASSLGFYLFLPLTIHLKFDGSSCMWSPDDEHWETLDSIMFPDCSKEYPPYLTMTEDVGIIQVWTGYVARTPKDWSLWVRGVPNYFPETRYQTLEGVIDTDTWVGPLFVNLRLHWIHSTIVLSSHRPFLQVVPIPRQVFSLDHGVFEGDPASMDWHAFDETLKGKSRYVVEARKRQKNETQPGEYL